MVVGDQVIGTPTGPQSMTAMMTYQMGDDMGPPPQHLLLSWTCTADTSSLADLSVYSDFVKLSTGPFKQLFVK
eukprot:SAG31_NODE_4180_length_3498_cov_4.884378_2_plen_73_part_00